ncbi:cytochrome c oxidase assembly factor 3, mitochondrial-like [Calliopsis andreniformis]|uniref:cytochrome c oxidase assembly factor 3, mitochondrial-like n=1 Tax=Calliopsis andreniformis TaxID=337506 RepID=UPI003FCE7732
MQAGGKDNDFLEKIKPEELRPIDLLYMKQAEQINFQRATKYRRTRRNNIILGLSLAAGVLGIYFYTMHAVKQETFLDDFNEPETIIVDSSAKAKEV